MTTYTSTAVRYDKVWIVTCDQYPGAVSTPTRLADAAEHQREIIAFVAGVPESEVDVIVTPQLPDEYQEHVTRATSLREQAETASAEAARETRAAVKALVSAGIPTRDIGPLLGVSHQRAQQLARSA